MIEDVTCNIPNQSIILLKNNMELNHFVLSLVGKRSIENGRIYIKEKFIEDNKVSKFPFFVISEDVVRFWTNFRLRDITKLVLRRKHNSLEGGSIFSHQYFSDLSDVDKLKYFLDLGKYINRKIFILENPVEKLDYGEMKEFKDLVLSNLSESNYIIIDRKENDIYKELEIPINYLS